LQDADIAMINECAEKMKRNPAYRNVAIEDLVYEGYIGFTRAQARYNPERGPFDVYARKCIRLQMRRKPFPGAQRLRSVDPAVADARPSASKHGGDSMISQVIGAERGRLIRRALSVLSAAESMVVLSRFGFAGSPKTRPELARELGISVGRVRWLQEKAIRKIRKNPSLRQLVQGGTA
jgi:RNA polymerase sigma factor (sigma-70 family)